MNEDRWIPEPNTGCWLWLGALDPDGYARIHREGRSQKVANYLIKPAPLHALHRCDVRCCVNPDHLYAGTHLDNMRDMARRGRAKYPPRGRYNAKLTAANAARIQASHEPLKVLAARYGVSEAAISLCRNRKTWGGEL